MKYTYYNPVNERKGCIYRAISKSLNKGYEEVKEEITILENSMNSSNKQEIFEKYLKKYNYVIDDNYKDINVFDIDYQGNNIVFCYDNDWYHMVCIIDNNLFDSKDFEKLKNLKIIRIYKNKNC